MFTPETLIFVGIIFLAVSFIKGATGFGFGLLSLPLLLLFLPPETAIPLILGLAFVIEITLLPSTRGHAHIKRVAPLVIGGIIGVPFGYLVVDHLPSHIIGLIVSVLIIAVGILIISKKLSRIPDSTSHRSIVGFISGAIHGASSLAGPFLASYLEGTGEKKDDFHADMVISTLFLSLTAVLFFGTGGYFSPSILISIAIMIPTVFVGSILGVVFEHKANQQSFHLVVLSMIIFAGLLSFGSQIYTML
jgi:uncharacterized protein